MNSTTDPAEQTPAMAAEIESQVERAIAALVADTKRQGGLDQADFIRVIDKLELTATELLEVRDELEKQEIEIGDSEEEPTAQDVGESDELPAQVASPPSLYLSVAALVIGVTLLSTWRYVV
jgi:hypothetical protein